MFDESYEYAISVKKAEKAIRIFKTIGIIMRKRDFLLSFLSLKRSFTKRYTIIGRTEYPIAENKILRFVGLSKPAVQSSAQ